MKLISTKQYNLQIIYIIETNSFFFYFEFKRLNCWYPRASLSLTNRPCQSEKCIQIYQLECILFFFYKIYRFYKVCDMRHNTMKQKMYHI